MAVSLFRRRSLKTRVTLVTLAIFLASVWALAIYVSEALLTDMQRLLGKQQFSTVSFVATDANRELTERLGGLGRLATMIRLVDEHPVPPLQDILESRPVLQLQFNGGFFIANAAGHIVDVFPPGVSRTGTNALKMDIVAAAIKEGRSQVGMPFLDPVSQAPVITMTTPIRDEQANVVGALTGFVRLNEQNFIAQLLESYYGRSGYFLLIDPGQRRIITASGKQRILESLPVAGTNPVLDRFIDGFDETGVMRDNGVEVLASARRVPIADWFIIAALPTDEAFGLIQTMQREMVRGAIVLTLLAGALTWAMLRRELKPMLSAIATLTSLAKSDHPASTLPVASHDEIGDLFDSFNHLLETLAHREAALQESEARFKALHDAAFGGIAIHDNGIIFDCNRGLSELTGYTYDELIGKPVHSLIVPEHREMIVLDDDAPREEVLGLRKSGERYHVSLRCKRIPYKGRSSLVTEFRDVSERKAMEEQIRQMALHDSLTRLPNRRLLNDRLRQAIAVSKRNTRHCALMFLDLDNFKPLNDAHGHEVGDLLLIEVARRLQTCVREVDTVARFGGDEFVILLDCLSTHRPEAATQAALIAEKARLALAEPYRLAIRSESSAGPTVEHRCTASIGVTLFNGLDQTPEEILKNADTAMYLAKEGGRNQVWIDRPEV